MTKIEYKKCEELMEKNFEKVKLAKEEYGKANDSNMDFDALLDNANTHYGEAIGMYNVLDTLGFKNDRMKELFKLIHSL